MIRTPLADLRSRLLNTFRTAAPRVPWNAVADSDRPLPTGLTAPYDVLNTLLLAYQNASSRYWATRSQITRELGLPLREDARSVLACFWKPPTRECNTGGLVSCPLYNLADVHGPLPDRYADGQRPRPPSIDVTRTIHQLIDNLPPEPINRDFSIPDHDPYYDLHHDRIHFGRDGARGDGPVRHYHLLRTLVQATAHRKRCGRRPHPPEREAFVTSLATAFLAHAVGLRQIPDLEAPETFVRYIQDTGADLLEAAVDAQRAVNTATGRPSLPHGTTPHNPNAHPPTR